MTRIILLEELKEATEAAVSELILPVALQKSDSEQQYRAADVHLMRLPDSSAATKKCPYILHQFVIGEDKQEPRERPKSTAVIRSVFAVYYEDEQEGALALMNLMERVRIALLRHPVLGGQFCLDLSEGFQTAVDYEDTAPYFKGEMVTSWTIPAVEREDARPWL